MYRLSGNTTLSIQSLPPFLDRDKLLMKEFSSVGEKFSFKCRPHFYGVSLIGSLKVITLSDLQIRGGIEDNLKIIFFYFSTKTYIVTPH